MWFCVDSCGTVETFETEAMARGAAEAALEDERDCASEGWSEEVTNIMWGKVYGVVQQTYCRPRTDDDVGVDSSCDEVADYHMQDVSVDV